MDEKLAFQMRQISKNLGRLKEVAKTSREDYLNNSILQSASERYLQLCIESCINLGNRLISILQVDQQFDAPKTYADVFRELEKHRITQNLEPAMIEITKFRNRLVHVYWEISPEVVYNIIHGNLEDINRYLSRLPSM
ncbi:type VII toxin-antitoxin system HepT family RNase toxin [Desulfosporosinus metallidurans]|uniref:DUF86 domain-containing protein n=1 Tax=Desulfosporosinus metallidurans TaxID=1888891 RepID=A0A1Q8QTV3_9FIRM|nr:DUF86 domain-containing protein [Desulfosporosinus metallidurans]OLN30779.1 hypothetical protein DSOL_2897 [Desulfosporosinus metallidurans]